jgi:hypothetical protein
MRVGTDQNAVASIETPAVPIYPRTVGVLILPPILQAATLSAKTARECAAPHINRGENATAGTYRRSDKLRRNAGDKKPPLLRGQGYAYATNTTGF